MIIQTFSCKQLFDCYLNLHLKFGVILYKTYKDMTLYPHMYQERALQFASEKLQYTGMSFI